MLSVDEAFEAGVLLRCAEEGLRGTALTDRIQKVAHAKTSADWTQLLSVPALAGVMGGAALGGTAAAVLPEPAPPGFAPPAEIRSVQNAETAAALRQQAAHLRQILAVQKRRRAAMTPRRSPYGI